MITHGPDASFRYLIDQGTIRSARDIIWSDALSLQETSYERIWTRSHIIKKLLISSTFLSACISSASTR